VPIIPMTSFFLSPPWHYGGGGGGRDHLPGHFGTWLCLAFPRYPFFLPPPTAPTPRPTPTFISHITWTCRTVSFARHRTVTMQYLLTITTCCCPIHILPPALHATHTHTPADLTTTPASCHTPVACHRITWDNGASKEGRTERATRDWQQKQTNGWISRREEA